MKENNITKEQFKEKIKNEVLDNKKEIKRVLGNLARQKKTWPNKEDFNRFEFEMQPYGSIIDIKYDDYIEAVQELFEEYKGILFKSEVK